MPKLSLDLEHLEIESFVVEEKDEAPGTVHGREWTADDSDCDMYTCGQRTCSDGRPCVCTTYEYTMCGTCATEEVTYCRC